MHNKDIFIMLSMADLAMMVIGSGHFHFKIIFNNSVASIIYWYLMPSSKFLMQGAKVLKAVKGNCREKDIFRLCVSIIPSELHCMFKLQKETLYSSNLYRCSTSSWYWFSSICKGVMPPCIKLHPWGYRIWWHNINTKGSGLARQYRDAAFIILNHLCPLWGMLHC